MQKRTSQSTAEYQLQAKMKNMLHKGRERTSLVVQWLRLHAPNGGGLGSILGWGTRSHMLQLTVCMPKLKILHATSKMQCHQINKCQKRK